ncbi:MAG: BtpA/SgcQ family protein [candidate division KSB1 bacterium]|nr:BtpA/SgcQ family protein [candidate division KSB1 bacterium]
MTLAEWRARFGHPWPLIGVVHLLPLPGSPLYGGSFEEVLRRAEEDARAYEEAGFDAVIVENFGDRPFFPSRVPRETVAAMAVAAWVVRKSIELPVGVNVLRSDGPSALAIATVVGAQFVRVNVHVGAVVTDQGLIEGKAWETLRLRRALGSPVSILADLRVKHAAPLVSRELRVEALEAVERGLADAVIITGESTGQIARLEEFREVREALQDVPVLAGSGVTSANLGSVLPWTDGAIVGTSVKCSGKVTEPVDRERVRELRQVRDALLEQYPTRR